MSKKKGRQPKTSINTVQDSNYITAILVDGGFFRKRIKDCSFINDPVQSAQELDMYCRRHLTEHINGIYHEHQLYRIFYYDCPPIQKTIFNPLTKQNYDFGKSNEFKWTENFLNELKKRRKFALRFGRISDKNINFTIKSKILKQLFLKKIKFEDLTEKDIFPDIKQKGVDMRIGLDIASLSYKKQVNQIVLISGDSDFVPAAKLARREGIDFILDPLGETIKEDLMEHIDGLKTYYDHLKTKTTKKF